MVHSYNATSLLFLQRIQLFYTSTNLYKTVPRSLKGKSKVSQDWLTRQLNDPFIKKAHEMNYRARSAFKLIEIDEKFKILNPGITVVECGCAPGAWTQVALERINKGQKKGLIIGVDLLDIDPIEGSILLSNSDFTSDETVKKIQELLRSENEKASKLTKPQEPVIDLVLSDMAPNVSGIPSLDHSKLISLVQSCLKFSIENAKVGSNFVSKLWNGAELPNIENDMRKYYKSVKRFKPKSSREDSAELYLIALNKVK